MHLHFYSLVLMVREFGFNQVVPLLLQLAKRALGNEGW